MFDLSALVALTLFNLIAVFQVASWSSRKLQDVLAQGTAILCLAVSLIGLGLALLMPSLEIGIATVSIALSSVLMLPFPGYVRRRLRPAAPRTATLAAVLLFLGCICLTFAGLITSHPVLGKSPLPRLHDILARVSVIAIAAGMLLFNAIATTARLRKKPVQPLPSRSLLVAWNLLTLPVLPITVTWLLIRLYLKLSGHTHHAIVHSLAWNLGFWEWIGSALIFLFLLAAALFLPQNPPPLSEL